jgi:hypothetical protein
MKKVVDLEEARLELAVSKGYRNWISQFGEDFGLQTRLSHISTKTLAFLARGREKSTFYLYDLIMNLLNLGSGFEFEELNPEGKMRVVDRFLFLLDQIRFEYMKRLGWLESYPGEEFTMVDQVMGYNQLAPYIRGKMPSLSQEHPAYQRFCLMNDFEKGELIRKLIPKAIIETQNQSTTL